MTEARDGLPWDDSNAPWKEGSFVPWTWRFDVPDEEAIPGLTNAAELSAELNDGFMAGYWNGKFYMEDDATNGTVPFAYVTGMVAAIIDKCGFRDLFFTVSRMAGLARAADEYMKQQALDAAQAGRLPAGFIVMDDEGITRGESEGGLW